MAGGVRHGVLAAGMPYLALGSGPPLLFIGGFAAERTRPAWLARSSTVPMLKPYAGARTVYAVSWQPADPPQGTTMADIAADYAHVIRSAFGGPVPVVGMSTGGSIAQQLAADHPQLVARLVLLVTAYRLGPRGRPAQRRTVEHARAGRNRQAWSAMADAVVASRAGRWALATMSWLTSTGFTPAMCALLTAEDAVDLGERLGEITAPTMVVGGTRDRCYGRELIEATAAGIPGARLVLYEGRGHLGAAMDKRMPRDVLAFLAEGVSG